MREIALDTETTGLEVESGDRIVEIGCVEMINHMLTGEVYHVYINPERMMSDGARDITGLDDQFLADKPVFAQIAAGFLSFVQDSALVIHNAKFDMKFLNAELNRAGAGDLSRNEIVDTLALAKKRFPGAQSSLDALCRRFSIDLSGREKHGALLDAELLAGVYLELRGGRQPTLTLAGASGSESGGAARDARVAWTRPFRKRATDEEREAHEGFVDTLSGDVIWRRGAGS